MAEEGRRRLTAFLADDYEALLEELRARGYRDISLATLDPAQPHMFLRHDVDLCMERALLLAEREAAIGVKATYYFLLSTRFYNLASARGRAILARLCTLGHAVGLHFDTTQYSGHIEAIEAHAAEECGILEQLSGAPVESLSFHRPVPELLNRAGTYAGRRHTYEPAFFSSIAYISDSNGGWHHGHPLDHEAVANGHAIQLLTHPIWWTSAESRAAVPTVAGFRDERIAELNQDLRSTVTAYRQATDGAQPD